jgi:hypothetical protein
VARCTVDFSDCLIENEDRIVDKHDERKATGSALSPRGLGSQLLASGTESEALSDCMLRKLMHSTND